MMKKPTYYSSSSLTILLISFYLILPLFLTFMYSISVEWMDILPSAITFRYYEQIFADSIFWVSLVRSVIISIVPVVLTALILLLVMYVVVVYHPQMDKYIQIFCTIPYSIQGIILAISVLSLYSGAPAPFSNRILLMVLTYCIIILPYMYQGIKNALESIDAKSILETAQILGAGKFYSFFFIILPNILSGIVVSVLLSIAIIFGDFVIVNSVAGNYYFTAQMYLFKSMFASGQKASAVVIILFLATLTISCAVLYLKDKHQNTIRRQK